MRFLSKYIKSVIDDLGIQDYSLIGFSLGGLISLKIAKNNPRVKEIILLNSFPSLITNSVTRKLYHLIKFLILNKWFLFLYSKINTNDDVRTVFKSPYINNITKKYMEDNYVSVFGTLFKCIDFEGTRIYRNLKINKSIVLVEDDEVIDLKRFLNAAKKRNFEITLVSEGGHNSKESYWTKMEPALSSIVYAKDFVKRAINPASQILPA
jgi:esterase/lipase